MNTELIIAMIEEELDAAWKVECERRCWYDNETLPREIARKQREWKAAKEMTYVLERVRMRAVDIANLER